MTLYNLKISTRLTTGFAIVLAMTVLVGIIGIFNVDKLADINSRFHDHPYTVVKNVGSARVSFNVIIVKSRDLVLAESQDEIAKAVSDLEKAEADYVKFAETAKAAFLGDKGKLNRHDGVRRL